MFFSILSYNWKANTALIPGARSSDLRPAGRAAGWRPRLVPRHASACLRTTPRAAEAARPATEGHEGLSFVRLVLLTSDSDFKTYRVISV